jgi:hypothetical protein
MQLALDCVELRAPLLAVHKKLGVLLERILAALSYNRQNRIKI